MIYLALLIGLLVLCVWSYKAMIDIKPQVNRPKLDQKASQAIDDLEGRLRRHVVALAKEIGPRGIYTPQLLATDRLSGQCSDLQSGGRGL